MTLRRSTGKTLIPFLAALLLPAAALAAAPDPLLVATGNDIPAHVDMPRSGFDYLKRDVMIPMRDGVTLHTVIVIPKNAHDAPILLTRTPYDATKRATRSNSPSMLATLPQGDDVFVAGGYIRVFQDVRGKYGSNGDYVMTRPPIGPLNPSNTDDTTDAWDTIDWLVKNLPESNGRVGMTGSSYEGWTVVMALLHPHPALKVASPESPMVDGWMGDDWFHYGAFRQSSLDYLPSQMTVKGEGDEIPRPGYDDYANFLKAGSAGEFARAAGLEQFPFWRRMAAHPAYDAFWQGQALDHMVAANPSDVPTLWEQGLWDQEDMWGAIHSWMALKAKGHEGNNVLIMGPWRHSQVNYDGSSLGRLNWDGDTALQYRRDILRPFFDQYLKPGAPKANVPAAFIYNTGENHWDRFAQWPLACDSGCTSPMTPLFLQSGFSLSFEHPAANAGSDSYVSDPAKPVPYLSQPVAFADGARWKPWLTSDQRNAANRPDVLAYETTPLTKEVRISGQPAADMFAATTGTDADWVVKLIDVFPDTVPSDPTMGGYQLPIAMDIFRGRYRESFAKPAPIPAGQVERYRFTLPPTNHVFLPGHRIMVQIQSSWFPLYDRNPQHYVDNIFYAKPADYMTATQRIMHQGAEASAVWLPVVPTP
ncbi:CocE/NonD family hydrolase [Lichenicola cladoniae]|uniref:CocE/NonD family hydrolase n=1 Tax=Lichenicola cladoniae TaxID=1484109 RepID=A0A6M8HRU1_9PROT|nr:CocE/NonD family hydrolase [Lichenicola cladoniae]NPD65764.1 CocE/NonD family hydrolase [Acetobacteraceae bacterium]QKE91219.1 CocE/NonD family hydrolase [Lichenicola cladoniae]